MSTEKTSLPLSGDVKDPLLPLPSPATQASSSSASRRPTRPFAYRVFQALLAAAALGSLYYQFGTDLHWRRFPHEHHRDQGLAAYAKRLAFGRVDSSTANTRHHAHGHAHGGRLSYQQITDTLLSVPAADSAKAASKEYTAKPHVAGTKEDRDVALLIKSQWEKHLGAPADPEHRNVFDAGTKESRDAVMGPHGGRHGKCGGHRHHKGKKHHHHDDEGKKKHHRHGHKLARFLSKLRRKVRAYAAQVGLAPPHHAPDHRRGPHEPPHGRSPHGPPHHGEPHGPHHGGPPPHDGPHGPHHGGPPPHDGPHGPHGPPHRGHSRGPRPAKPRVWTDTYYSLLNYPVKAALSLTRPGESEPSWTAKLQEDVFAEDPTSGEGVGIWHGFSKNGTVKGQLVYASRGTKEDFEYLASQGIDVKGKVVAVQYGGSFRGLKVKAASEAGAVGVVIFTDPIEDGDVIESAGYKPYPHGPARAPSSVQRGSVQYLSLYPGDPLTPGKPSYNPSLPNAPKRLPRDSEGVNVPDIPSIPLSYEDAIPLLKSLNGKGVQFQDGREGKPKGWKEGGLRDRGVEYWTGPGDEEVELTNIVDERVTPIWNTYAIIPGQTDDVVVLGNHHDAWTFGAGDPSSGTASVHETVRAFGALLEKGWKPLRTIMLAAWSSEEFGLIGSTEFGEDFSEWLQRHVVTYLNVDVSVAGSVYDLAASPSLADLLKDVSAQVPDPDRKGKSLADVRSAEDDMEGAEAPTTPSDSLKVLNVAALGSGSDFTVFLQRLGLASANFGMRRGRNEPVYHYHSNFDSFHWQSTYGDPSYERHVAISRVLGLTAARLADDLVLPINITAYSVKLGEYLDKVEADPLAKEVDLSSLRALSDKILSASRRLQAHAYRLVHGDDKVGCHKRRSDKRDAYKRAKALTRINHALKSFEAGFLGDEEGLQGREWYRHLGVAPGRWLGYGATTLPGLAEALALDEDIDRAKLEVQRLERAFKTILHTVEAGLRH